MTTCKRCGETPDPDHLMRLLTSLERRLLDAECGYIELEQGLSVQEEEGRKLWEETRKLREHANSQWVQIDRLRDLAEPVAREEAEDKADCRCCDYKWKHYVQALDDAEEAAADYHAAWQDAAVYWKGKVARLEQKALLADYDRVTAELNVDNARAFAQRCWGQLPLPLRRQWIGLGQVPAWIRQATNAAD